MKNRIVHLITVMLSVGMLFCSICYADTDTDADDSDSDSKQKYYYHDVYNTGKDNGYSGHHEIDDDDMHYGWKLGKFEVSGFVDNKEGANGNMIFFKNYNTQMQLDFILEQDIEALDGDDDMYICNDKNGYDEEFNVKKGDIVHGCLIVQKKDYQNNITKPIVYGDYLVAVTKDQNSIVTLLEEGDYIVALDYEIRHDRFDIPIAGGIMPEYGNYRIMFEFSVRNSNCMVFVRDALTQSELPEKAITENGFFLDLANSHYLSVSIKRSTIAANGYSLTEDTRYHAIWEEGKPITDEGLYDITVTNPAAGLENVRRVYVGTDPVMKAYVVSGYSLEEIQEFIKNGAVITDEGEIIMPLPTATPEPTSTPVPTVPPTSTPEPTNTPVDAPNQDTSDDNLGVTISPEPEKSSAPDQKLIGVAVASILVLGTGLVLVTKRRKKESVKKSDDQQSE